MQPSKEPYMAREPAVPDPWFRGWPVHMLTTSMLYFHCSNNKLYTGKECPLLPLAEPLDDVALHPPRTVVCHVFICCHLVPVLVRHGGHSILPLLHSVYARLLVLSSINSLTGSVLKNCSTTTSIGTSLPCWRDCFMDVNAGHSLHKCQAVSISSSKPHWIAKLTRSGQDLSEIWTRSVY